MTSAVLKALTVDLQNLQNDTIINYAAAQNKTLNWSPFFFDKSTISPNASLQNCEPTILVTQIFLDDFALKDSLQRPAKIETKLLNDKGTLIHDSN